MAENSITYNFDEIMSSTLLNWRDKGKYHNNVFKSIPTFWWIYEKMKNSQQGGERIVINIQFGKNTTVGSYSRYDIIDITPQDNQTSIYYPWKQFSGAVTIDGYSTRINQGKSRIVNLLEAKITELENSMAEDLNTQLWRVSPGSKDILSIPAIIVLAPQTTDAASPGGLSGTTKSYWRNQTSQSAATTWKGVIIEAKHLYNLCSKGGNKNGNGAPDLGICDQNTYEHIENYMTEQEKYVDADLGTKARSVGFQNIKFKNANLFWDEMVPDAYGDGTTAYDYDHASYTYGALYFLNTNHVEYVVMEGCDLVPQPFLKPVNQDARTSLTLHMHNFCINTRKKHGVLHHITRTLSA